MDLCAGWRVISLSLMGRHASDKAIQAWPDPACCVAPKLG